MKNNASRWIHEYVAELGAKLEGSCCLAFVNKRLSVSLFQYGVQGTFFQYALFAPPF